LENYNRIEGLNRRAIIDLRQPPACDAICITELL
jgi:hypothetical protein